MRISRWGGLSQWGAFLSRAFIGPNCITWSERILLNGCLSESIQVRRIIILRCFSKQSFHWSKLYHMIGKDTADWLPKWEYLVEEDYHSFSKQSFHSLVKTVSHDLKIYCWWLPKWEYPGEEDYHSEVLFLAELSLVKTVSHDWLLIGCLSENI